jgi:hypothetical protein
MEASMSRMMVAALMGALSLMFLSVLGLGPREASASRASFALPAVPSDAPDLSLPRDCDTAKGITTSCTYG